MLHSVPAAQDAAKDIDPQLALELLPQKIAERKKVVSSIALDLTVLAELGSDADPAEVEALTKQLVGQKRILDIYEARLGAVNKLIRGE